MNSHHNPEHEMENHLRQIADQAPVFDVSAADMLQRIHALRTPQPSPYGTMWNYARLALPGVIAVAVLVSITGYNALTLRKTSNTTDTDSSELVAIQNLSTPAAAVPVSTTTPTDQQVDALVAIVLADAQSDTNRATSAIDDYAQVVSSDITYEI